MFHSLHILIILNVEYWQGTLKLFSKKVFQSQILRSCQFNQTEVTKSLARKESSKLKIVRPLSRRQLVPRSHTRFATFFPLRVWAQNRSIPFDVSITRTVCAETPTRRRKIIKFRRATPRLINMLSGPVIPSFGPRTKVNPGLANFVWQGFTRGEPHKSWPGPLVVWFRGG